MIKLLQNLYFLLSVISGITRCTAHNEYRIRTAKDKYKHGDWLNPDIHISGGHTTDTRYKFPDDLVKLENINQEFGPGAPTQHSFFSIFNSGTGIVPSLEPTAF